jgi:hypothetical protein
MPAAAAGAGAGATGAGAGGTHGAAGAGAGFFGAGFFTGLTTFFAGFFTAFLGTAIVEAVKPAINDAANTNAINFFIVVCFPVLVKFGSSFILLLSESILVPSSKSNN